MRRIISARTFTGGCVALMVVMSSSG